MGQIMDSPSASLSQDTAENLDSSGAPGDAPTEENVASLDESMTPPPVEMEQEDVAVQEISAAIQVDAVPAEEVVSEEITDPPALGDASIVKESAPLVLDSSAQEAQEVASPAPEVKHIKQEPDSNCKATPKMRCKRRTTIKREPFYTPSYALNSSRLKIIVAFQSFVTDVERYLATLKIEELGGRTTENVEEATVYVVKKLWRSTNLVCAIGKRIPIVTLNWVDASYKKERFEKPANYALIDESAEERYDIYLERIANESCPFFVGFSIHALPQKKTTTFPSLEDVRKVVRCCDGTYQEDFDKFKSMRSSKLLLYRKRHLECEEENKKVREALQLRIPIIHITKFFKFVARHSRSALKNECKAEKQWILEHL
ncbi:hypothetical protein L596_011548 [Steinernema carpocapsae]|nr:hypothetical protein L596_011548 [Steinernema carpocapsae]